MSKYSDFKKALVRGGVLVAAILASSAASAQWLIDTGPGLDAPFGSQVYDNRPGEEIYSRLGAQIQIGSATTVTGIQAWVDASQDNGLDSWAKISLYDASGAQGLPGATALYSQVTHMAPTAAPHPDWRGIDDLSWGVQAGSYWVVLEGAPGHPESIVLLPNNPFFTDPAVPRYAGDSFFLGGQWLVIGDAGMPPNTAAGFGLRVAAVPEASTMAGLMLGLAFLYGSHRLRSRGRHRTDLSAC